MVNVSIIGKGNMGQAISSVFSKAGPPSSCSAPAIRPPPPTATSLFLPSHTQPSKASSPNAANSWRARSSWTSPTR